MDKIMTEDGDQAYQLTMDEMKEFVADSFRTIITELGLDKIDLKHEVFPGQDNEEDLQRMPNERQADFLRSIVNGDIVANRAVVKESYEALSSVEKRAYGDLAEGTDAKGGYLTPPEFINEVLRLIPSYGVARQLCNVIPVSSDSITIPTLTADVTAYWVSEGAAITTSKPTFSQVAIAPKKAAALTPATTELLEDTNLLVAMVQQSAAIQFAGAEDNQLFNGTGSSPAITGIFASGNVTKVTLGSGKTSLADLTFADLLDVEYGADQGYLEGASWLMNRAALKYVRRVKDDAGQFLWDRIGREIDLYPYMLPEKCPTTVTTANKGQIALGNLKKTHIFADRRSMKVDLLREGYIDSNTNLATQDLVAFRFTERVDIQEALASAVVVLWTAAS